MTEQLIDTMNADTKLFQVVRKWFQANPDTQIPLDAWERKLVSYGLSENPRFSIKCDGRLIRVSRPLLPALASLSLGLGREHLGKTICHHGGTLRDVENVMSIRITGDHHPSVGQSFKNPEKSEIIKAMTSAMMTVPELRDDLLEDIRRLTDNSFMELLRVDDPRFWPNTSIEEFSASFRKSEDRNLLGPEQADVAKFTLDFVAGEETSGDQIIQWIERAGYINPDATFDNGYPNTFFHDVLIKAADGKDNDAIRIIAAINSVHDEGQKSALSQAIIGSLSNRPPNGPSGEVVAEKALALLDPVGYADVVNSPILRLNLLEWPVSQEHETSPFHIVDESTLFRELEQEIMAIEPSSMRYHHFLALRQFAKNWPQAQHTSDVEVDNLVAHVTRGLLHYLEQPRWGGPTKTKQGNGFAQAKVEVFLKMTSKIAPPDYNVLNELDSASKRFLCSNGYNIRSFSGMSRQDKGQVLSDDLGL